MSPRSAHSPVTRTDSLSPYPSSISRKPPVQPKSTRQQYSACGACRIRRVKCDLKDLPTLASGQHPPCSNCSERGINCVDEFAEVKAVKLLRRGRRIQRVEAVYGKLTGADTDLHAVAPPRNVIPQLKPEFFRSPFFHRFHIQRPILEPTEYSARFSDWFNGISDTLQIPGQLIALVLAVWAASYGIDEGGEEGPESSAEERKGHLHEMLVELLYLIDVHGLLRKPSWDGVRVLLLAMPLVEEFQTPIERLAMYDSTMSQVWALCSNAESINTGQGEYIDALVRARVFWYAHILDGVTSGLRGGRMFLNDDDLTAFEATLPPPLDSDSGPSAIYSFAYRFVTVPLRIAQVCREIHAALTGPKARQQELELNEDKLQAVWDALETCWRQLESLRQASSCGYVKPEDIERFVDGWQIFLFESHNVIRETLKSHLVAPPVQDSAFMTESARRKSDIIMRLHMRANSKCHTVVRHVVAILRKNLGTPFFQYDAALTRDGCFFAGFLLAGESGTREEVEICLRALSEMRWTFSKSTEREGTVRAVWQGRATQARGHSSRSFSSSPADEHMCGPGTFEGSYIRRPLVRPTSVPPLSLSATTIGPGYDASSAPNTACTADGRWPSTGSGSGSESEQYQGSSHRSSPSVPHTSSSYPSTSHNPLALNHVLHNDGVGVGPSPLLLGSSRVPTGPSSGQSAYYVTSYSNYLPVGDAADARQAPAASGSMEALPVTDQAPTYSHPTTSFDYTGVSYSSTALGQPEAGSSYLPAASTSQGGSPPFGSGPYY
ncbi:hypothetical protein BC628DRAFT_1311765 [Trametes gibbosa]|nr:hypothetical protein BC628DRAFT_1311765 [Trametes gibbosa]UVI59124.1 Zn(2)-Cys(6)23 [Trametes gibbosa]